MRYRIYFLEGLHPQVEVWCREGTLRIVRGTTIIADSAEKYISAAMSRILDDHGRCEQAGYHFKCGHCDLCCMCDEEV
jgi:hypothetical protein